MAELDLAQALQMFTQGAQQAATTQAVSDATQQMHEINRSVTEEAQKRQQLQQLGNDLALRLVGTGANAATIGTAFNAVSPQNFGSAEQLQLEGQLSGNKFYQQQASNIIEDRRKQQERLLAVKHQYDLEVEGLKRAGDLSKEKMKHQQKMMEYNIPDFKLQEGFQPQEKDLQLLKTANADIKDIDDALAAIDKIVSKEGTEAFSMTGPTSRTLQNLHTKVIGRLKSKEGLGALAGPDMEFLAQMIPDPTSFMSSGETYQKQVKDFKEQLLLSTGNNARSRGYSFTGKLNSLPGAVEVKPGVIAYPQTQRDPATGKAMQVYVSNDGRIFKPKGK